jgi:hypothetical protein
LEIQGAMNAGQTSPDLFQYAQTTGRPGLLPQPLFSGCIDTCMWGLDAVCDLRYALHDRPPPFSPKKKRAAYSSAARIQWLNYNLKGPYMDSF